jgi:hypothetical protein
MSRISRFLEKRKEECSRLAKHKTSLTSETKNLKAEKDKMQDKINRIYEKEQYVTYYLEWFYKLREELWNRHRIRIEAIGEFAKVINDFAAQGYDAYKIISEYNDFQSVKDETMAARCRLLNLEKNEQDLRDKIVKLETQCESVTQTMNTYSELKKVGLGLKELKQLLSTIMEIANANGIPNDKAVDKFFRNIREQYDNKLGFEKKVDEKMIELVETENKLVVSQAYLQLQPHLGPILNDFLRIGFTLEDIKNIHLLVFRHSGYVALLNDYMLNTGLKLENKQNKQKPNFLNVLNEELEKYGDINSAIRAKSEQFKKLHMEIGCLNKQKVELVSFCNNAMSAVNYMNNKISYLNGCIDSLAKDINNGLRPKPMILPLIIVLTNNTVGSTETEGQKTNGNADDQKNLP